MRALTRRYRAVFTSAVVGAGLFSTSASAHGAPSCVAILSVADDPLAARLTAELALAGDEAKPVSITEPLEITDLVDQSRRVRCDRAVHVTSRSIEVWEDVLATSPRLIETRDSPQSEVATLRLVELVIARRNVPPAPPPGAPPSTPPASAEPNRPSDRNRPNGVAAGVRSTGIALVLASYTPAAAVAFASFFGDVAHPSRRHEGVLLGAPLIGPFLYIVVAEDGNANDRADELLRPRGGPLSDASKALIYASAAGQIAGVALLGIGEIVCATERRCTSSGATRRAEAASARWDVFPIASPVAAGLGVRYARW